jgi:hypothetical protein
MAWQFAFHGNDASRKWLYTGGLSALEGAFGALGWDDSALRRRMRLRASRLPEMGNQRNAYARWL